MKRLAAALLLVGVITTVAALGAERSKEGFGGILLGVRTRSVESLNSRLRTEGYGTFPSSVFSFGGWGWGVSRNWVFGGSGTGFVNKVDGQIATATLTGGVGFFEFGHKVESTESSQVIGFAGFGGGGYTLKLVPFDVEQDFNQILKHPRTASQMTGGQVLAKLGIQIDWIGPEFGKKERTNLTVGVRLEYIIGLTSPAWKVENVDLRNAPDVSLDGFLLTLAVGFRGIEPHTD